MFPPAVDLALSLALSVVPALLFLGLYRGLERLRDDDLVNRWLDGPTGRLNERTPTPEPSDSGAVRCHRCGTVNPPYAAYCARCLDQL
ncbi:hypothetical protein [Halosegnis sp.]|uniref:hypothetical protein n=1 Tax=Halosegnis sp. TaxID=2864959 RepID=UPI0035D43466